MPTGVLGAPFEFLIFGVTLLGVAILHKRALTTAVAGLIAVAAYKLVFTGFAEGAGFAGLVLHFAHEWVTFANLMLLLVGFAVVAHHFEESQLPLAIPKLLPNGWLGGFVLLVLVFALSIFLDNIAGAVIGGVVAKHVYNGRVGVGYLASIVAAANAGGSGSVIGDTTTTMIWLSGVSPLDVLPAFLAAGPALVVFGVAGALAQSRLAPIDRRGAVELRIDWPRSLIVLAALTAIIGANVAANMLAPGLEEELPLLGIAIWVALLAALFARQPDWTIVPSAAKGAVFLVALVGIASLMPVESLPAPSWLSVFGLGLLSSVFDNIPLTALAIEQGGYDWAMLAYAVGFGGSMVWFGSSAGVALTGVFPEGRSVFTWLRRGWHVPIAYVAGFAVLLAVHGWRGQ